MSDAERVFYEQSSNPDRPMWMAFDGPLRRGDRIVFTYRCDEDGTRHTHMRIERLTWLERLLLRLRLAKRRPA